MKKHWKIFSWVVILMDMNIGVAGGVLCTKGESGWGIGILGIAYIATTIVVAFWTEE